MTCPSEAQYIGSFASRVFEQMKAIYNRIFILEFLLHLCHRTLDA